MQSTELLKKLFEIGVVKKGNFTLKSGASSSVYVDLRLIVSYPKILQAVADNIWQKIASKQKANGKIELLCGVPYTALPIATCISVQENIPMLLKRKEAKNYGTKKMIEGLFQPGQTCVVIEDVITTGSSIIETVDALEAEGLKVHHAAALVDREQGGRENLAKKGCELTTVFSLRDFD